MNDFSIIIPHRGNPLGLWATIHSCEADFVGTEFTREYIVVSNGEPLSQEVKFSLEKCGGLVKHSHFEEPLTPPVARARGAEVADGRLLCFSDNHCLVGRDYFTRVAYDFERKPMDMLHSVTSFSAGLPPAYHYRLSLEHNFWAESAYVPFDSARPYQVAAAGHGNVVVKRDVWNEVGGYGPDSLFVGYAGEEILFDLKMWMLGKTVWIDPKLFHYHYIGERPYPRHYTDDYYTNLLACANVIGGEQWMHKVFHSFTTKSHTRFSPSSEMYDLMITAYERSRDYAQELAGKRVRTLDETLVWFRSNLVAQ